MRIETVLYPGLGEFKTVPNGETSPMEPPIQKEAAKDNVPLDQT